MIIEAERFRLSLSGPGMELWSWWSCVTQYVTDTTGDPESPQRCQTCHHHLYVLQHTGHIGRPEADLFLSLSFTFSLSLYYIHLPPSTHSTINTPAPSPFPRFRFNLSLSLSRKACCISSSAETAYFVLVVSLSSPDPRFLEWSGADLRKEQIRNASEVISLFFLSWICGDLAPETHVFCTDSVFLCCDSWIGSDFSMFSFPLRWVSRWDFYGFGGFEVIRR